MLKPLPPRPARGTGTARRLALFALVVTVQTIAARWFDLIDTLTLIACLSAAVLFGLAALVFIGVAFVDIWRDGAPGFGRALGALALAGLTLAPFAAAAGALVLLPPLHDVATDTVDPPVYVARPPSRILPFEVPQPSPEEARRLQLEAYPDLLPRTVPLSTVEAYAAARLAAVELGWTLLAETEPLAEGDPGRFEAEARSLLLGTPEYVAVRIRPAEAGTRIDVRSASRAPMHDLGENARRIRAYFARLDEVISRTAGG